jgi:hypothetical protein
MKFRQNWCLACTRYLPPKGASSHKCLYKGEVFIGESKIKCCWHNKKANDFKPALWCTFCNKRIENDPSHNCVGQYRGQ